MGDLATPLLVGVLPGLPPHSLTDAAVSFLSFVLPYTRTIASSGVRDNSQSSPTW